MNPDEDEDSSVLPLTVTKARALRGPNVWSSHTAIEVALELKPEALPVAVIPGLEKSLKELLPGLEEVELGPTLAHALERIMLELQQSAGCPISFSRTAPVGGSGRSFKVVVEQTEEQVGERALELGRELLGAALANRPFDAAAAIKSLRSLDERVRLGPSTGSIARAAERRGIPVRRLNDGNLLQLGWGSQQRRIWTAETDRTSAIAESIAKDKELTKVMLRAVGVPVPEGRTAEDAEDAWRAAQEIGGPVVVKPLDGNQGRGVAVNLTTREQVVAAYEAARQEGDRILVERFAPGADHRLLVIGGRLIAAARREPPKVYGDGKRTIAELVDEVNQDPRRGEDHATSLSKIRLDDIGLAVLAEQGLTPQSVPPFGKAVLLRRNANLSTGGSAEDVTDRVHPELAARAVDAVRAVGLDIGGVDLVCTDVSKPLEEQCGVVVEVNAGPGFRMHLEPSSGKPRPVGDAVVEMLYPIGQNGRIPLVAVTGNNGKTTTVRLLSSAFKAAGKRVGMTCTDGLYVDGRRLDVGDCSGPKSARAVLFNPMVDAAVLETARGGILREGLGFDRCDVAVVTNIGDGDHLGMSGVETAEQLAEVKRTVVANVAPGGMAVLNAADHLVAAMAKHCPGSVTFFARDPRTPALAAHRAAGGRVVFVENGAIVAVQGSEEHRVIELAAIPVTQGGRIGFQIDNCLATVGAAWGVGMPWEALCQGLVGFVNDCRSAPGRFNVLTFDGATVVADYGHNPDALLALVDAVEKMPSRRRVVVISAAGDRRDQDIVRMAGIVGAAFDEVILYEDACNRGRKDGECLALMRSGLAHPQRATRVSEVRGETVAMEMGLRAVGEGDLLLALVDQVEPSLEFLEGYIATHSRQQQVTRTPRVAA